ncbi:MAG: tRNA pseudouridine(38-40) synthase TruA [Verrucomicrobia bacterium]|nr:tRNA pseudouridine(38-40) synthase TruA [Verrucomicrobiota bacterium]
MKRQSPAERVKLTIAYNGKPFSGWQSQPGRNSVQDHLQRAFQAILKEKLTVYGAGRTDAGVHALAQTAHVELPPRKFAYPVWISALNAHLPPEIRILNIRKVSADFHAQFSAIGKQYRYRIWQSSVLDPMEIGRAWHIPNRIDVHSLQKASEFLVGKHDFASFSGNRRKEDAVQDTVRIITALRVRKKGPLITVEVEGNGFLYRMVRMITASLVRVGIGREKPDWINEFLERPGDPKASYTAPAQGLYLVKVIYPARRDLESKAQLR